MNQPDFIQIPTILLQDKDLKPLDRIVYGYVYVFSILKNKSCFLSNSGLAKLCGSSPSSIANCLTRLEKKQYIMRNFKDEKKKKRTEIIPLVKYGRVSPNDETVSSNDDTRVSPNDEQKDTRVKYTSLKISKPNGLGEQGNTELEEKVEYGNPEINALLSDFNKIMGFKSAGKVKWDRIHAKNLLKEYNQDQIKAMLVFCSTDKYAPRIGSISDLFEKRGRVVAGIQSFQKSKKTKLIIS